MEYKTLIVEIKNGIGIVWMNRPKQHNALDDAMTAELTAAMRRLEGDPAVRIVILAGAGESFCAGADPKWMRRRAGSTFERSRTDAMNAATLLHAIDTLKKPTVARVHGSAFDEGVGLIAACDVAVAAYDAEFCLSGVRFGLVPATVAPYVARAMGERAARRYLLSAERFTAAEAYRLGLLNDLAQPKELDGMINDLLGALIQGGPCAQTLSKEWIRVSAGAPIDPALVDDGVTRTAAACASQEGREGITAFNEKRTPAWISASPRAKPGKPATAGAKPSEPGKSRK